MYTLHKYCLCSQEKHENIAIVKQSILYIILPFFSPSSHIFCQNVGCATDFKEEQRCVPAEARHCVYAAFSTMTLSTPEVIRGQYYPQPPVEGGAAKAD